MNGSIRLTRSTVAAKTFDFAAVPAVYIAANLLKLVRRAGFTRLPLCRRVLLGVGVLPVRDHYYEPFLDGRRLRHPLAAPRQLPGIDWNTNEQLTTLAQFHFNDELLAIPEEPQPDGTFYFGNSKFGTGDAEYLYNLVRLKKPQRIIEIGSGYSTLITIEALKANRREQSDYLCEHVCIEPYEMPWLERTPVTLLRKRVEELDVAFFSSLSRDDLLFIDSTHVVRPQGDVLFEYLDILPTLKPGVIVHAHDIFSPRDYPSEWLVDEIRLWNEQYLLEAFLTLNHDWKIIGALNFLHHAHYAELSAKCPRLRPERRLGSFYIQKRESSDQSRAVSEKV